jgi:hypothetical protein
MGKWGNGEMGKWGNGEMGKWGNGEMGRWGNGGMGEWGNGGIQLIPQHPKTPTPNTLKPQHPKTPTPKIPDGKQVFLTIVRIFNISFLVGTYSLIIMRKVF